MSESEVMAVMMVAAMAWIYIGGCCAIIERARCEDNSDWDFADMMMLPLWPIWLAFAPFWLNRQ